MARKHRHRPCGSDPPNGREWASRTIESNRFFGHARKPKNLFRAGLCARVSSNGQQAIPLQMRVLREYAARRGRTLLGMTGDASIDVLTLLTPQLDHA